MLAAVGQHPFVLGHGFLVLSGRPERRGQGGAGRDGLGVVGPLVPFAFGQGGPEHLDSLGEPARRLDTQEIRCFLVM